MAQKQYPHQQPFNIRGNHTDKRGWWMRGNNNAKKGGAK